MIRFISGFLLALLLFWSQSFQYPIIVTYTLFWLFGIASAHLVKGPPKAVRLFYLPMAVLLTLILVVELFPLGEPVQWELFVRIPLYGAAAFVPPLVHQQSRWVKLVAFVLLLAGFYAHQILARTNDAELLPGAPESYFKGLREIHTDAPFKIPKGPFYAFSYNANCGYCQELAEYLKARGTAEYMPVYAIKVPHKREAHPKEIMQYVKELGLPENQLLMADVTIWPFSKDGVPNSFFYKPGAGLQIMPGVRDGTMDHLEGMLLNHAEFTTPSIPYTWQQTGALYFLPLLGVFWVLMPSTSGKRS